MHIHSVGAEGQPADTRSTEASPNGPVVMPLVAGRHGKVRGKQGRDRFPGLKRGDRRPTNGSEKAPVLASLCKGGSQEFGL
jgi:hypothetical protein